MRVLLDTHMWVWWLTPDSPLSSAERAALDAEAARRELFLSAISLWETQVLHAKQRLELPLPFADWLARAADERVITVLPLSVEVVFALDALPPAAIRPIVSSSPPPAHMQCRLPRTTPQFAARGR